MRIDDRMKFPHPVLWSATADYRERHFGVSLNVEESAETGRVVLNYAMTLDEPALEKLLADGIASTGLLIACPETYLSQLLPVTFGTGSVDIAAGRLRGRVIIRPVVWASRGIDGFNSAALHAEFGQGPHTFGSADILGIADEAVIYVGHEKFARMESIFTLCRDDAVAQNQIALQIDGDTIQIRTPGPTFDKIHRLRGTEHGRSILLNGVYLPAILDVLAELREAGTAFEGRRWHRVFTAKTVHLGIDVTKADLLATAQQLLQSPLGRINLDAEGAA